MNVSRQVNKQNFGISTDLDVIDKVLQPHDQFLIDAGCGNMHLSKALAARGAHVLAIDPDPIQAAKNSAADIVTNVGFAETGADQIPVEDQSVDGILFPYSLHHVPKELYEAVFGEVLAFASPSSAQALNTSAQILSTLSTCATRRLRETGPMC